jgi:hypothetical protein
MSVVVVTLRSATVAGPAHYTGMSPGDRLGPSDLGTSANE